MLHPSFPHPPSCPAFPQPGFASRASRDLRRIGTMRALTPARLSQAGRSLRLLRSAFRTSRLQTRHVARTSRSSSRPRIRPAISRPGFALNPRARRNTPLNRVRTPTGCPFASGCSPPRLAATQLRSVPKFRLTLTRTYTLLIQSTYKRTCRRVHLGGVSPRSGASRSKVTHHRDELGGI